MFSLVLVLQSNTAANSLGSRDLEAYGLKCFTCRDPRGLLELFRSLSFDMIVIDRDSITDIEAAIEDSKGRGTPAAIITTAVSEAVEMECFVLGAVAVLNWRHSRRLLSLKIKRLVDLRGEYRKVDSNLLAAGRISLNPYNSSAMVDGAPLNLTVMEFQLLYLLASNFGNFVHRQAIRDLLGQSEKSRGVDMIVSRLRAKIRPVNSGVQIELQYSLGYRLCEDVGAI